MKRKLLLLSLVLVLAFSGIVYASGVNVSYKGHDVVKVTIDGKEVAPDGVPGYLDSGNTMVPLGMLRKMGVTVEWNKDTLTANVKLPTRTVPILIQSQLDELSKYVYKIEAPLTDDPTKARQGSGFLVNGVMITNAHVIGDSTIVQVQIDGRWLQVKEFQFINETADLAGFTVAGGKSLPYSTELPQVGDPVYDISFPHGELNVAEGKVYSVVTLDDGITTIAHSAKVEKGGSGGIVLNGRGEIIAVNKSGDTLSNGDYITMSIPISYVLDEINKLK